MYRDDKEIVVKFDHTKLSEIVRQPVSESEATLVLREGHPGGSDMKMEYTDFGKGLLPGKPR